MSSLRMFGPFDYTNDEIDIRVNEGRVGNYALGYMKDKTFIVKYVGRSDTDLNRELKVYLDRGYEKFKYSYANSVMEAYEKECENYHDFGESDSLDNENHPAKPADENFSCPICES